MADELRDEARFCQHFRHGPIPRLGKIGVRFGNVRTVLLGSVERLFLNVRSSVASVFHIRPVLAETLWVSDSHACNSAIVASGRVSTWASTAPCKAASRRGR